MILVDTSVWIDFFRDKGKATTLPKLLAEKRLYVHPWVFGELMVGELGVQRKTVLNNLTYLPSLPIYDIRELLSFVESEQLFGKGLSLIDIQLLYTCLLNDCLLWTADQVLRSTAKHYKIEAIF